jgi:hypothetical protein
MEVITVIDWYLKELNIIFAMVTGTGSSYK